MEEARAVEGPRPQFENRSGETVMDSKTAVSRADGVILIGGRAARRGWGSSGARSSPRIVRAAMAWVAMASAVMACSAGAPGPGTEGTKVAGENPDCATNPQGESACDDAGTPPKPTATTPEGCYDDPACSVTETTWDAVGGPLYSSNATAVAKAKAIHDEMVAIGCTAPRWYLPCAAGSTLPSGKRCGTSANLISICPTGMSAAVDALAMSECDQCTGQPGAGHEIVVWRDTDFFSGPSCGVPSCAGGKAPVQ